MEELIQKLIGMKTEAVDPDSDLPCEYLYGRAGYLYALLFVNKYVKPEPVDMGVIRKVRFLCGKFCRLLVKIIRR